MTEHANVTIYDVAKLAGVSASTVSRTFSSPARVSEKTVAKVHEAARTLGYKQTGSVYWEDSESPRLLGIVMVEIANPVYRDILKGFQDAAAAKGYSMVVINSPGTPETEKRTLNAVIPFLDGIAFPISYLSLAEIRKFGRAKPVVLINRHATGHTCVVAGVKRGVHEMCEHLQELGHTRLTYLAGPEQSWTNAFRWRALQRECEQRGLYVRQVRGLVAMFEGGEKAARRWRPEHGTAVVAFNDAMAVGFIREIRRRGMAVPQDVSVVGFDNSYLATLSDPPLTSLSSGGENIGRKAAESLIWQNNNRRIRERKTFLLPVEFAVRGSTGPAPVIQ
ncbi:LacI family DNA-binding transcriptional regulator [Actinobaculum suis]|uniref:LacI family DNA-binding transcriptional regulator n=1 Tax=Actinobaculum suis TaxID=1657 RepID=UPI000808723C|nr:LacI family DNA-binding transcriptional regulator [Actinobaculum suis]OCA93026.1 hypothetical protein ACU21_01605 [Actinobaculum suis]OCA93185.1 hypothetical protein ACU20_02115 [Actinobaculum suis]